MNATNISTDYLKNYDAIAEVDLEEPIQPEWYLNAQADRFLKKLRLKGDEDVCDIGVGRGKFLERLSKDHAGRMVGIDLCQSYLDHVKSCCGDKVELIRANAEDLNIDREFDVIVSTDVLEHVINVGDFLDSVFQALKPGGRFIVRTPYLEDYTVYSTRRGCPYEFVHLRSFSKSTLKIILAGAGFIPKRHWFDGHTANRPRVFSTTTMGVLSAMRRASQRREAVDVQGGGESPVEPALPNYDRMIAKLPGPIANFLFNPIEISMEGLRPVE